MFLLTAIFTNLGINASGDQVHSSSLLLVSVLILASTQIRGRRHTDMVSVSLTQEAYNKLGLPLPQAENVPSVFVGGWPDRVSGFPNGEMDSTSSFDVFTSAFLSLCLSSSSAAAAAIQGTVQLFGPIGNARTTESYHGDNV